MNNNFDIIVFGSATVDFFLTSKWFDQNFHLESDAKIDVEQKLVSGGGGGTNVAAGLSRLGLKTALVARLGQDQFSSLILDELKKEGVCHRLTSVLSGEKTDSSIILVNQKGKKVILVSRGFTRLEAENINWEQLDASWFHLSSLEGNLKLASALISYAKTNNVKVSWNPGSRELLQKEKLASLLTKIQILILNQKEIEDYLDLKITNSKFWPEVYKIDSPLIAITQNQKGCFLVFTKENRKIHLAAVKTKNIEATGAGDAFCSGIVAGLYHQAPPRKAALWGLANGASVVSYFGAKTGLLTKKGIKKWLKKL
ncbi:MAG: carbohydrate kinase family protein [Candidatus Shapirobacteria bacterium]